MEKKTEKKTYDVKKYLKLGFWIMLGLFVLVILLNQLSKSLNFLIYIGIGAQVLLYMVVVFVFVNAIWYLSPEKGFAIIALILSGALFLMLLLSLLVAGLSGAPAV